MNTFAYLYVDGDLRTSVQTEAGEYAKFTESDITNHLRHEFLGRTNKLTHGITMKDLVQDLFGENLRLPEEQYSSAMLAKVHAKILNQACVHSRFAFNDFDPVVHFLDRLAEQHGGMSHWYKSAVDQDDSGRERMKDILNGITSNAAQGGNHKVIDAISWHIKDELENARIGTSIGKLALHRLSTGLHYMVMEDSTVPYQNIIGTIESFERAGYNLKTFGTKDGIARAFNGYAYGDNLMHHVADKAHQKSHFALEVLTYLTDRGLDPWLHNHLGTTPIEMMKNNPTRNAWREMLRQLKIKKAAMDVLDELGLGGLSP